MKKYLYIVDGKKYSVSEENLSKFLAKFPNARTIGEQQQEPVKKKETTIPSSVGGENSNPTSPSESQSLSNTATAPPAKPVNPYETGNDLYDFMVNPSAYGSKKNVENKLNTLQPVTENDVRDLKINRPDLYDNVRAGLNEKKRPVVITDDSDVIAITQKLNKTTSDYRGEIVADTFKKETGLDYTPLNAASITATKRKQLGIAPLPGDEVLLMKEFAAEDLDKRFGSFEEAFNNPNPFVYKPTTEAPIPEAPRELSASESHAQLKQSILDDPKKTGDYFFKRQQEDERKVAEVEGRIAERKKIIGVFRDGEKGSVGGEKEITASVNEEIEKDLAERNGLLQNIQQQKFYAEKAADLFLPKELAKKKGIDIETEEGKTMFNNYLATKRGREEMGFNKKRASDPSFEATLEDFVGDKVQEMMGVAAGNPFSIVRSLLDPSTTELPKDGEALFNALGDGKFQSQMRLSGHEAAKNYAKINGDTDLLQRLTAQDDAVILENGKARQDELAARLSNQRFKNNNNSVDGGARKIFKGEANAEEMRQLARDAKFSDLDMKILEKDIIPDELSRSVTSIFQTSGFGENFVESIGGIVVGVGNLLRSDQSRIKENLNGDGGRLEDIGQYSPFLQELQQLEGRKDLSKEEQQRKKMLEENTNLLNGWQKLKAGSGNVTGQVVGQALFASLLGGVGGVLARGLGFAARGGAVVAEAEFLTAEAAQAGRLAIGSVDDAIRAEAAGANIISRNAAGQPVKWSNGQGTFISREAVGTVESGLTAEAGGARILARNAEGQPIKWSFNGVSTPAPSTTQRLIKENANLFLSSTANAYDGYAKEALQEMPGAGNGVRRSLYTGMMATFEGLSEKIFPDTKIFKGVAKEISPTVVNIASQLSNRSITQAAAIKKLEEAILGGDIKKFAKNVGINANKEGWEEVSVSLAGDAAKAMILGQNYDVQASIGAAFKTYYSMVVDGGLVAAIAARGDVRSNSLNKTAMYHVASNAHDYRDEVTRLRNANEITQEQADEKHIIINTTESAYQNMRRDGIVKKEDEKKNAAYLLHTVNQAVQQERAANTTDDVRKADLLKQAERSKKIRQGLYDNTINVDEFLNTTTPDQSVATDLDIDLQNDTPEITALTATPKLPQNEVDIIKANPTQAFQMIADQAQGLSTAADGTRTPLGAAQEKQAREKYGDALVDKALQLFPVTAPADTTPAPIVLTPEQKKQTALALSAKPANEGELSEKAQFIAARKAGTGDEFLLQAALAKGIVQPTATPAAPGTPPTIEQKLKDIIEGNTVTFTYKSESEIPEVFKDKVSSSGETNGEKIFRVTLPKSEADYFLSNQQNTTNESTQNQSSNSQQNDTPDSQKSEITNAASNNQGNAEETVAFKPEESQYAALERLTQNLPTEPAERDAEIKRRAEAHGAAYDAFTQTPGNEIADKNKTVPRVKNFGGQTEKAMKKFLTPEGKQEFKADKGAFENGSRIDENGKTISENDFVELKEKVKALRKENNLAEIAKINSAPRAYLDNSASDDVTVDRDTTDLPADDYEEQLQPIENMVEANKRWSDGHRVFQQNEMDESLTEVQTLDQLKNSPADKLFYLPKQDAPNTQTDVVKPVKPIVPAPEAELNQSEKPDLTLNLMKVSDLVKAKDEIASKKAHEEIEAKYEKLQKLMECL